MRRPSRAVLVTGCSGGIGEATAAAVTATPDHVAKVVLGAVTASRPRARYPVTPSARLVHAARRLLPDRAWDAFLATQFVRPGPHRG